MAKPSEKTPAMEEALDDLTRSMFGRTRTDSIRHDKCVTCGDPVGEFRDALRQKEFGISGMCQKCQDSVFGG